MKNRIIFSILVLFCSFSMVKAQQQNKVPVTVSYSTEVLMDEFDMHLYQAAQHFISFEDEQASEEIKKAAFYISMQAYNLKGDYKKPFLALENKLIELSVNIETGKIVNIQQLVKSYAESHLVLAKFYIELSNEFYSKNDAINSLIFLDAAGSYLMLGSKWVGFEVGQGTRSTRKSIANLVTAANSRNEINNTELKKVLDFINKEIKKFDSFLTK
ncbi:MAG: hypothetical protein JEZ09_15850 [Salinivirgaceae bacterium]|nr:hypothetical protein [Salinivirgaceae bacterium]